MKKFIKVNGKQIMEIRPEEFEGSIEVEITDGMHDLDVLREHHYVNGKLVKTDEIINKANLSEEYFDIKQWFVENDWKVNKVIVGEWTSTDFRFEAYLSERKLKRERLDKVKEALGIE